MARLRTEWLLRTERRNAVVAWVITGLAALAVLDALIEGNVIRAGGAVLLVCTVVLPAVAAGSWRRTFVWPLALLVTLPAHFVAYGPTVVADVAAAMSLATFALAVVIDLHLVTDVRMSTGFTAAFVVIATLGFAGFWAVFAWVTNAYLGTGFVATNTDLMIDLLITAGTGLCISIGFEWYVRRRVDRSGGLEEGAAA